MDMFEEYAMKPGEARFVEVAGEARVDTLNVPALDDDSLRLMLARMDAGWYLVARGAVSDDPKEGWAGWLWPAPTPVTRATILDDAKTAVTKDRAATHGNAEQSFAAIAAHWSVLFGVIVEPWQVAQAMILLKIVRAGNTPDFADHWTDIAGYAACGGELALGGAER